jgi:hypothetical protein
LLGGQGGGGASDKDDINLERNQFGRKSGEPLELPLGISVFNHDVAAVVGCLVSSPAWFVRVLGLLRDDFPFFILDFEDRE